jgi:hypothetical protein
MITHVVFCDVLGYVDFSRSMDFDLILSGALQEKVIFGGTKLIWVFLNTLSYTQGILFCKKTINLGEKGQINMQTRHKYALL